MAAAVAAGLMLVGCSAGQISQTADQVAAIDGANATAGQVSVLNAHLAETDAAGYPAGGSARLQFWLANAALTGDQLLSISSPVASGVDAQLPLEVAAQSRADFQSESAPVVQLTGLTQEVRYGFSVPVVFQFEKAGEISVNVPIAIPEHRTDAPRETVDLMAPHKVPLWHEGGEGGH